MRNMETPSQQHECKDYAGMEKSALVAARVHYSVSLQAIMMNTGFPHTEWPVWRQSFLRLMQLSLLDAAEKLHDLKKVSNGLSDEESEYLNVLRSKTDLRNIDPMMEKARKSSNDNLSQYLKKIMIGAGYDESETEENHSCYLSFYSKFFAFETEKLIRYLTAVDIVITDLEDLDMGIESESYIPNVIKKSRMIVDDCSEEWRIEISDEPLISTKKHEFYSISTPSGIRLLKTLKQSASSLADNIIVLQNEFNVSNKVSHHSLREVFDITSMKGKHALLLEWVDGYPISDVGKFSIIRFLSIARDIVSCLSKLHDNSIFHTNLSCDHILFNDKSNTVKIIGYGLSANYVSKKSYVCSKELLERDLRYTAPELTGRIDRLVDHRSDFYSLGIIFYKMLSGKYPFDSKNASILIQMHISQKPIPLHKNDVTIPIPISNLIYKLLEKSPDDRYQSANGVIHDIDLLLSAYQFGIQSMNDIAMAERDKSNILLIPQNLYGRSAEQHILSSVMDRVIKSSAFELVLVKGHSGTGGSI